MQVVVVCFHAVPHFAFGELDTNHAIVFNRKEIPFGQMA
jgi:hypothetical protein